MLLIGITIVITVIVGSILFKIVRATNFKEVYRTLRMDKGAVMNRDRKFYRKKGWVKRDDSK